MNHQQIAHSFKDWETSLFGGQAGCDSVYGSGWWLSVWERAVTLCMGAGGDTVYGSGQWLCVWERAVTVYKSGRWLCVWELAVTLCMGVGAVNTISIVF